jgi:hypothetical protein
MKLARRMDAVRETLVRPETYQAPGLRTLARTYNDRQLLTHVKGNEAQSRAYYVVNDSAVARHAARFAPNVIPLVGSMVSAAAGIAVGIGTKVFVSPENMIAIGSAAAVIGVMMTGFTMLEGKFYAEYPEIARSIKHIASDILVAAAAQATAEIVINAGGNSRNINGVWQYASDTHITDDVINLLYETAMDENTDIKVFTHLAHVLVRQRSILAIGMLSKLRENRSPLNGDKYKVLAAILLRRIQRELKEEKSQNLPYMLAHLEIKDPLVPTKTVLDIMLETSFYEGQVVAREDASRVKILLLLKEHLSTDEEMSRDNRLSITEEILKHKPGSRRRAVLNVIREALENWTRKLKIDGDTDTINQITRIYSMLSRIPDN